MANAMIPLANITLSSAVTTVSFTNFTGSDLEDLVLVARATSTVASAELTLRFRTTQGVGLGRRIGGDGSSTLNQANSSTIPITNTAPTNINATVLAYSRTFPKQVIVESGNSADRVLLNVITFTNPSSGAGVDQVTLVASTGSIAAGSTFALYGVRNQK